MSIIEDKTSSDGLFFRAWVLKRFLTNFRSLYNCKLKLHLLTCPGNVVGLYLRWFFGSLLLSACYCQLHSVFWTEPSWIWCSIAAFGSLCTPLVIHPAMSNHCTACCTPVIIQSSQGGKWERSPAITARIQCKMARVTGVPKYHLMPTVLVHLPQCRSTTMHPVLFVHVHVATALITGSLMILYKYSLLHD